MDFLVALTCIVVLIALWPIVLGLAGILLMVVLGAATLIFLFWFLGPGGDAWLARHSETLVLLLFIVAFSFGISYGGAHLVSRVRAAVVNRRERRQTREAVVAHLPAPHEQRDSIRREEIPGMPQFWDT